MKGKQVIEHRELVQIRNPDDSYLDGLRHRYVQSCADVLYHRRIYNAASTEFGALRKKIRLMKQLLLSEGLTEEEIAAGLASDNGGQDS